MKPRQQRKPRKTALSRDGVTVEELCRHLHFADERQPRYIYWRRPADRDFVDRIAAKAGADAAVRVKRLLLHTRSEEESLDRELRVLLELFFKKSHKPPPMPQGEKLYRRWLMVVGGRNKRLSFPRAYKFASDVCEGTDWAGKPGTMKAAYDTIQRIRRAIENARKEREPGQ